MPARVILLCAALCGRPRERDRNGGEDAGGDAGGCSPGCTAPGATAACVEGACVGWACLPGRVDTDGDVRNGCEGECSDAQITATGALDFDLKVVRVSGRVTVNGADPGPYNIVFDNSACADGGSAVPCQKKSIRTVEVTSSGGLDVDLRVARVSGRVTANGQAVRASAGPERGRVVFTESEGSAVSAGVGATGDALYTLSLIHGAYAVSFANATDCPRGVLPCQSLPLREGVAVNGNASLDLDLKAVQVGGAVKVNGAEMPASVSGAARGALDFLGGSSAAVRAGLGITGPAVYSAQVFSGAYGVRFDGADCPATGDGAVPCQDAQLLGCPR